MDNLTISDTDITPLTGITWAAAGTTITGAAGDFSNVRVGDVITSTSGTDFANTQTVTVVAADGSSVDFAPAADGNTDAGTGNTLTFNPGTVDATLYIVRITHTDPMKSFTSNIEVAVFDGSIVGANTDDEDFANGTLQTTPDIPTINMETFYANCRIDKTN